jgi:hypothetical protein
VERNSLGFNICSAEYYIFKLLCFRQSKDRSTKHVDRISLLDGLHADERGGGYGEKVVGSDVGIGPIEYVAGCSVLSPLSRAYRGPSESVVEDGALA